MSRKTFIAVVLIAGVLSFLISNQSPARAGWCGVSPICPGDHVFDSTRFAKSVETTVEAAKKAFQTLDMFNKRLQALMASTQLSEIQSLFNAVKDIEGQILSGLKGPMNSGKRANNPIPGHSSSMDGAWKDFIVPTEKNLSAAGIAAQNETMRNVTENANYDAWNVARKNNETLEKLTSELSKTTTTDETGNQGTKQNTNAARAILIKMMVSNIYADIAMDTATQTKTKEAIVQEDMIFRRNFGMKVGSYDPYQRTKIDDAISPAAPAIGFPKIKP